MRNLKFPDMKKLLFLPLLFCICINTSAQFSSELYFGDLTCGYDSVLGDYYDVEIILDNRLAYSCAGFQFEISNILIDDLSGGLIDQYNWMAMYDSNMVQGYSIDVTASGTTNYTFAGDVSGSDPNININLGDTLTFNVNATNHPFWLKSVAGIGQGNAISVANNGAISGSIVWVPSAVGTYYYNCEFHSGMTGNITVSPAIPDDTSMVIAFYFPTLQTLPSDLAVLTVMRFTNPFDSSRACLSNFIYSDSVASAVPTSLGPCLDISPDIYDHNAAICNGDSTLLGGIYQTIAGAYDDTLMAVNGCDSIIRTALAVNATYEIWDAAAICQGDSAMLGNTYYSDAGTYYDSLQTVVGCDSVFAHELTVNALPVPVITQNGNDLSSSTGVSYQWYLDGTELVGETNQDHTASADGAYVVSVTDSNGCEGSSNPLNVTLVGLEDLALPSIQIFPNPMEEKAVIVLGTSKLSGSYTLLLYNHIGKKVREESVTSNSQVTIHRNDLSPGIYFIELIGNSKTLVGKVIIK